MRAATTKLILATLGLAATLGSIATLLRVSTAPLHSYTATSAAPLHTYTAKSSAPLHSYTETSTALRPAPADESQKNAVGVYGSSEFESVNCDSTAASHATERGWIHYRANQLDNAELEFRRATLLCNTWKHAWTGLGYIALRQDRAELAVARFDSATSVDPRRDSDELIGLGMATFRLGDLARARVAFLLADSLLPGDTTVAEYLRRLPAPVDASQLPPRVRPSTLQMPSRVGNRIFEVRNKDGGWEPLWIKAVNLGAALPGKHPSEFPPNDGTYESWIRLVADMGANSLRVYTIHPPHFYSALKKWNEENPNKPLWLIHGVWTELPPGKEEENYDDPVWHTDFMNEARQVIDLLHGNAAISPRAGHATGLYTHDVSKWTLGYIIGREWEPYSVVGFSRKYPEKTSYRGRFIEVDGGNAVDVWLAGVLDTMAHYELEKYNAQRPMAYTNWPTLDPLFHPTETTRDEEAEQMRLRGEVPAESLREFDNDAIGLDANVMRATSAHAAGLFESYHAYPHYPDFMVLDPGYALAESPEGPSSYFGYLRELVEHHGSTPVVISEYGVPSSRGNAHFQPQGWHHGGHDEEAQAQINARLTRDIHASGAAGAGLFALLDEWFKKNWLVIDFENPLERNRLWLSPLDPEQNYGVIALRSGHADSAIVIDGKPDDWKGRAPLYQRSPDAPEVDAPLRIDRFYVHSDEAYVYFRLDVGAIDWRRATYTVGIDTWAPDLGDSRLPYSGTESPVRLEFVLDLRGPTGSHLLVDSPYNLYRFVNIPGSNPPVSQAVYNRPFRTEVNNDGRYDTLVVTPNRRRIGRDGTVYPAQQHLRNELLHALQSETTLADWYADTTTSTIEVRIAWGMLHVLDPSSRNVLFGRHGTYDIEGVKTPGFHFVVESLEANSPTSGAGDRLPRGSSTPFSYPPLWTWNTWETPQWHQEVKPLFEAMRKTFESIPNS